MHRKLSTKIALVTSVAALALGTVACEVEPGDDPVDPGLESPGLEGDGGL